MKKITQIDDTLRFVPESFDPVVWQVLSASLAKGSMRAVLAPEPGAVVKVPKSTSPFAAVDLALDLLSRYGEIIKSGSSSQGESAEGGKE